MNSNKDQLRFSFYYHRGLFWFRIFGRGLMFKNKTYHPYLFPVNPNNINKRPHLIKIGNWAVEYLNYTNRP